MAGGGGNVSISTPKLNGIQVQTSVYGTGIPRGWGTFRVSGNLIWYGDFQAIAQTQKSKSGGKGGGGRVTNTTYTYKASLAMALAAGPIAGVRKVYRDQSVLSSLSGSGLSLATGAIGQAPWGFLTTKYPSQALGYSGLAYVYAQGYQLTDSAVLQNHSFEVQSTIRVAGKDDANPAEILPDFLSAVPFWTSGLIGDLDSYSDFCMASDYLLSPVLEGQMQGGQFLKELLMCSNSDCVWSDGVLKIVPLGDKEVTANGVTWTPDLQPIYDLTDDDFQREGDEDPVLYELKRSADSYNYVQIKYRDRNHQYNEQIVPGIDQANIDEFGQRKQDPITLSAICRTSVATAIAQVLVQQSCNVRRKYRFRLPWNYCLLEPLDLVTITSSRLGLDRQLVRVESIDEDEEGELEFVVEEVLVGVAQPAEISRQEPEGYESDFDIAPGNTTAPLFIHPPRQLNNGDLEVWLAMAGGEWWGGAEVWVSLDDVSYERQGSWRAPARYGVTTDALSLEADPDTTSVLGVDLTISGGELTTASQTEVDDLATLCLVGTEVIAYRDATLTGTANYDLEYLRRGLFGTTAAAHASGAAFARLDDAVYALPYREDQIGQTIYIKLRSFNVFGQALEALEDLSPYSITLTPNAAPYTTVPWETVTERPPALTDLDPDGRIEPGNVGGLTPGENLTFSLNELVTGVANVETVSAANASAIAALEATYGDTASAAESAAAAAASESNAIQAAADAVISEGAAASSASTAATEATNAATQAGLAAGSATSAGNSATAAAGSATTATTAATNAGNSATAASASAVSAASSYTASLSLAESLLPERIDTAGNYFVKGTTGQVLVPADVATLAGFGPVRTTAASGAVHMTKGFFPATTGKIYEISGRVQLSVAGGGSPTVRPLLYAYDSSFAYLGSATGPSSSAIAGGGVVTAVSARFSDTTPTGGTAWTSGAVWLRGGVILQGDAASTIYVRSISVRDATAVAFAEGQATASATSASAAATSATSAGSSASAAQTSETNAATSAGAASTSATQASNSATTASGHASTASTQATNAANSATSANNSATAASGSASTAATHATDAGNSATAAASSAVSAASSYSAASVAAAMQFPDRYEGVESYFTSSMTGSPSVTALASNATEAGYGPVYDLSVVGAGSSDFGTRGLLPAIAGRIYKVEFELQRTAVTGAGSTNATPRLRCLNSSYADVAATNATAVALTGSVQTFSAMFSDVASTGITAWAAGAVWLRPHFRWQIGASTTATVRVRRITVTDVTEQIAALSSANAAATSASSASTSATNAGTSASAASTSATNASTSAGAASTSATNASNSATTASGHASNASTSATAAAGSATAAGNSATAAAGSASTASTQATNAGNSATAAAGSAVSAASSYTATLGVAESLLPERIDSVGNYFVKTTAGAALVPADVATLAGFGFVRTAPAGGAAHATKGFFPATSGKIYEVSYDVQVATAGGAAASVVSRTVTYAYDVNFAYLGMTTGTNTSVTGVGTVYTITNRFGVTAPTGGTAWFAGAVWLRAGCIMQGDATTTLYVRRVSIRDVTAVASAEAQASAAATSASSAATSASAAGTSATAASGSATSASTSASSASTFASQASTSATNAGTSATASASSATAAGTSATAAGNSAATATTQASNASTSAASAAASAVLAASVSAAALNKNARFIDFPATPGLPADWASDVSGSGTRVTGEIGGYAYQANGAAAGGSSIVSATSAAGSMTASSWYVVEAQVRLDLGALTGAGVRLRQFNTTPTSLGDQLLTFATDTQNNTTAPIGVGTVGRTYRFAKLIQTVAATDRFALYADTHNAAHGSIAAANRLTWYQCSVRPASPEEIAAGDALPALSASVTTLQGVVTEIEGRTAAWLEQTVEAGSSAAAFVRLYAETSPGVTTSSVSIGAAEIHIYNQDGEDFIKALSVIAGNAMFYGGLQAGAFIRQGSGDGWPVALKTVPFNLTDGQTVLWGTTFDSLPAYTTAMNNLAPLTAGETYDIRLVDVTKTGATAYCKIITPGSPTSYSIAASFAGGTSAPDYTVGVTNASRLESVDGTYDLTIQTTWTTSYKNFTTTGSDPFTAEFDGTVTVNIYALKAGVWTSVGTQTFEHSQTYEGFHDSPAWIEIGPSSVTQTRTVNLGSGVQAIGVEYASQTGAVGPYAAGTGEMDTAAWQAPGSASTTRTATPSGTLTRFTVIPQ